MTSTIASHLPRATGVAFAIERRPQARAARRRGRPDAIVVCSFGDASANHASALAGVNTAAVRRLPGAARAGAVRVRGQRHRDQRAHPARLDRGDARHPQVAYFTADGRDLAEVYDAACRAVELVRGRRRPALLHLRTVRLMGHAGSDVESAYRTPRRDRGRPRPRPADRHRPPARRGRAAHARRGDRPLRGLARRGARARRGGRAASRKLTSAAEVMAPLAPRRPDRVAARGRAPRRRPEARRRRGVRRQAAGEGGAAHPRPDDQPHARRRDGRQPVDRWCSARTSRARAACTA